MVKDFEEEVVLRHPCDDILGRSSRWDELSRKLNQTNPSLFNNMPNLDEAAEAEEVLNRAGTELLAKDDEFFWGANEGNVALELRKSNDDEDRGGFILRITSNTDDENFVAYARNIPKGVEVHLAGDGEGRALIRVLTKVLSEAKVQEVAKRIREEEPDYVNGHADP